jgi:phospholipid-translocating ATPase
MRELSHIKSPTDCLNIFGYIDSEPPNTNLYAYSATFNYLKTLDTSPIDKIFIPISANGLLLRGCVLRNTQWVIGIVAFTGSDTKLMLNSGETPNKRSNVDKQINPHVLLNFSFLMAVCIICGLGGALYNSSFRFQVSPDQGITPADFEGDMISGIITFFNCLGILIDNLVLFQNLIPIALYISLEFTKSAQVYT